MSGETSGKGGKLSNREWWTKEVAKAVEEKREQLYNIEMPKVSGERSYLAIKYMHGHKKKAHMRAVDKAHIV